MAVVEVFVDESRGKDYILCAVVAPVADLSLARKIMRTLKPNNRDRLHMHAEGDGSRRRILAEFLRFRPIREAHIWVAPIGGRPEREVRSQLLAELAAHTADLGAQRIVVESCSQDKQDIAAMTGALAEVGALGKVCVGVDTPKSHELLWAADLIAYAYRAGGKMRSDIRHLITIHTVS